MSTHATFSEHDSEPVRGLPAALPPGERVLWQGAPAWRSLALDAYRVRILALYFAVIVIARGAWLLWGGSPPLEALRGCMGPAVMSVVCLAILCGIAALCARATVYTLTNKRLVIRQGIALSSTINLPFCAIESANLRMHADGTGDITLQTTRGERVSYLWLWPHVRPWRLTHPQPALRNLVDARTAADLLARTYAASVPGTTVQDAPAAPLSAHPGDVPMGASA
jgi:hypothetical protein